MNRTLYSTGATALRTGRSGDRIPVGARISAPVQPGPGAYPASYTMGTGSFQGIERPGRGADHPSPSSAEVEGRVELYICSPSGPPWPLLGRPLPLPLLRIAYYILYTAEPHNPESSGCTVTSAKDWKAEESYIVSRQGK